ncbi:MAG: hypothetical protein HQL48_05170 [Gammaproteobacteria bacterium]|nr:hypothetical protein [Gammaproteobacteria bacterium]
MSREISGVNELRCWQQGKLIIDESDMRIGGTNMSKDSITFKKGRRVVHLFNMDDSFCLYVEGE